MLVMVSTDPSGSVQDDIKTGHHIMGRKEKRERRILINRNQSGIMGGRFTRDPAVEL